MKKNGYLGVDVGSISINFFILNDNEEVVFKSYIRGQGDPVGAVQQGLKELEIAIDKDYDVKAVCVTGSGRSLIGAVIGADIIKNEIMTHARAAIHTNHDVKTIIEIGGQDSKVTIIRDGIVVDFAMNLVCAAGTGSFLDSQAKRLNISIDELSNRSVLADNPTNIAGRCTVFAESDMIHKQQTGHKQEDILMGLCHSLVRNYLSNVCRGKEIKPPVFLQGGISANKGIYRAFKEALNMEIHIPDNHMDMGAYGAALIAKETDIQKTRFRGYAISDHSIVTGSFQCKDCSNLCEVVSIEDNNEIIGKSGGRCGKWENSYE